MLIEYTPEGGEPQLFDAGRMRTSEVQIVERTADMSWNEVLDGLRYRDVTAMRTVAFVIQKRADPSLRLSAFDPYADELRVYLDAKEVRTYADEIFKEVGDDPEELAKGWEELRDAAYDKEDVEVAIREAQAPKAPEPAPKRKAKASPSAT
ncbi:hypothetical protein ACFW4X_10775 [Streptomyces smyrnaeus]|uniref:hypothetical protein n=1 Tax=Streptomyces smyrnaeus TaxID=1387713 RepID=UPI0036A9A3B3